MALAANLAFQEGRTVLSFDGANAFNSIYRHRMPPALAEIIPSATIYATNLYARQPPKLLFAMEGRATEVIPSARGVQQGCNLGPLCYSAGSLKLLREFQTNPPVPGARALAFIDDITVILPPARAHDTSAIAAVTSWLQERLALEGVQLNRSKSQALLAGGVSLDDLTAAQQAEMVATQLTVVGRGMRVVGVPVGTADYQRESVETAMREDPAELLRALVPMEDAQASFQIMRLSAVTRMTFLLRALPPSVTRDAAKEYDAMLEWALASVIAGEGAIAAGLAGPDEVRANPNLCKRQHFLGEEALRQAHLPVREGGLGLISRADVAGAAYIGSHALALGRVLTAASTPGLPAVLERLPGRPLAAELIAALKEVGEIASEGQ